MSKVLVTGGAGLLGSKVIKLTTEEFKTFTFTTYNKHLTTVENCESYNYEDYILIISIHKTTSRKRIKEIKKSD